MLAVVVDSSASRLISPCLGDIWAPFKFACPSCWPPYTRSRAAKTNRGGLCALTPKHHTSVRVGLISYGACQVATPSAHASGCDLGREFALVVLGMSLTYLQTKCEEVLQRRHSEGCCPVSALTTNQLLSSSFRCPMKAPDHDAPHPALPGEPRDSPTCITAKRTALRLVPARELNTLLRGRAMGV